MAQELDIDTCEDHGDEWTIITTGGETYVVPQNTRHRLAREVLAWIAAGGTVGNSEPSRKRRVRNRLKDDLALRVIVAELADMQAMTPKDMRTKLIGHLGA